MAASMRAWARLLRSSLLRFDEPIVGTEQRRLLAALDGMQRRPVLLRREEAHQPAGEVLEIDIDDRRDEQRQRLRRQETTDDGDAERLAQFSAGAGAERD